MRVIELSKNGATKVNQGNLELYQKDLEVSSTLGVGEWVYFLNSKTSMKYLGFVNSYVAENRPIGYVSSKTEVKSESVEKYLKEKIRTLYSRKSKFFGKNNFRLSHGIGDGLPGLVIDIYDNCTLIQIATAGIDNFRTQIKEYVFEITNQPTYITSNELNRSLENLPTFDNELPEQDVRIVENDIIYSLNKDVLQKNGYYFDHRENRRKAQRLVRKFGLEKTKGLDLFSYIGSWGLNLLSAGCSHMSFVDQGQFEESIADNLKLNKFEDKGEFIRKDVFKYVIEQISLKNKFNVICSDPPAFTKSKKKVRQALEGYKKLHRGLMKIADTSSLLFVGSCTKFVTLYELDQTVQEAALKEGREVILLDLGTQGHDHTTSGLANNTTYIKFLAYYIE